MMTRMFGCVAAVRCPAGAPAVSRTPTSATAIRRSSSSFRSCGGDDNTGAPHDPADQRTSGPADQRTSGPADQRTSGPRPADQRTNGPADRRVKMPAWVKPGSTFSICSKICGTRIRARSRRRSSPKSSPTRSIPGRTHISLFTNRADSTLTIVDDGRGMQRRELARYHDVAASSKARGEGIGFAGVGIKLGSARVARGRHGNETRSDARGDAMASGIAASRAMEMDRAAGSHGLARHGRPADPDQSAVAAARCRLRRGGRPRPLRAAARRRVRRIPAAGSTHAACRSGSMARSWRGPAAGGTERAPISIRLGRRRNPSATGFLERHAVLASERAGHCHQHVRESHQARLGLARHHAADPGHQWADRGARSRRVPYA